MGQDSWFGVYKQERGGLFSDNRGLISLSCKPIEKPTQKQEPNFCQRVIGEQGVICPISSLTLGSRAQWQILSEKLEKTWEKYSGASLLLLVSCSSSGINVREAASARGGNFVFNCPGGTFFMGFICKVLDHFPRETVEPPQCWMLFLKYLLQPNQPYWERLAILYSQGIRVHNLSGLPWPWGPLTLQLKLTHWISVPLPCRSSSSAHGQCDKDLVQNLWQVLCQL